MAKKRVLERQMSADSDSDAPDEASFSAGRAAASEVRKVIAQQKNRLRGERRAQHEKNTAQKEAKRQQMQTAVKSGSSLPPDIHASPEPQDVVQISDPVALDTTGPKKSLKTGGLSSIHGRSILRVKVSSERRPLPPSTRFALQGRYSRRETVASFLEKQQKKAVRRCGTLSAA